MRPLLRLLLPAALAAAALAGTARAELPDLGGREVVVVTENAYPPLQFVDPKTGEAIGWEYDAMNEMAKRLNFTPVYETSSWDAMIPAVREGQYDIGMTGITIRADRAEQVDFSDPYMRSETFMLVRADEDRFSDEASFIAGPPDLLIGAQPGTTSRSTTSSTATRRTRGSSSSRPSAPASRRSAPATSTSSSPTRPAARATSTRTPAPSS